MELEPSAPRLDMGKTNEPGKHQVYHILSILLAELQDQHLGTYGHRFSQGFGLKPSCDAYMQLLEVAGEDPERLSRVPSRGGLAMTTRGPGQCIVAFIRLRSMQFG